MTLQRIASWVANDKYHALSFQFGNQILTVALEKECSPQVVADHLRNFATYLDSVPIQPLVHDPAGSLRPAKP